MPVLIRYAKILAVLICLFNLVMSSVSFAEDASLSRGLQGDYELRRRAVADRMEKVTVWVLVVNNEGTVTGSGSGFIVDDG